MGSGARLRSDNQAFGRSRANAFLLSAEPGPQPPIQCEALGGAQNLFRQVKPDNAPTSNVNCVCGNWPEDQPFARELRFPISMNWLGWEDPPHPSLTITGDTSGAVITVPVHCAIQFCQPQGPVQWQFYGIIPGMGGVDFGVVVPQEYVFGYWNVGGPGAPFIDDEPCTVAIEYTPEVLPDPGPYNIASAGAHPEFIANVMVFNLDRSPRWNTQSIVQISGTGTAYDGIWEAFPLNRPTQLGPNDLSVVVPNYGPLGVGGTLTRIFSPSWDCYYNQTSPTGPPPAIPGGSTPQVLTVGSFSFAYGYEAGAFGQLVPTAWDGQTIEKLATIPFQDVTELRTVGNVPFYGNNSVGLWVQDLFPTLDGRFEMVPVVAGEGTYRVNSSSLADYLQANDGADLKIAISEWS